jgi:hypothetical protein
MGALDDLRDPIRQGMGETSPGMDAAIIRRHQAWLKLHPELAYLFCAHGSYVGFKAALAYRCRRCAP